MPELISVFNASFAVRTASISVGELVITALLKGLDGVRGFIRVEHRWGVELDT